MKSELEIANSEFVAYQEIHLRSQITKSDSVHLFTEITVEFFSFHLEYTKYSALELKISKKRVQIVYT